MKWSPELKDIVRTTLEKCCMESSDEECADENGAKALKVKVYTFHSARYRKAVHDLEDSAMKLDPESTKRMQINRIPGGSVSPKQPSAVMLQKEHRWVVDVSNL